MTDTIRIAAGHTLGIHTPNFINDGKIVDNGALEITGTTSGIGTFNVGGILTFDNIVGSGQTIGLQASALLVINDPAHFDATISVWQHNARIEVPYDIKSVTFDHGALTLYGAGGLVNGTIHVSGGHDAGQFQVLPGGHSYITI